MTESARRSLKGNADRKRAKYVADTLGLWLSKCKGQGNDDTVMLYSASIGQMRFIRRMLNKVARG